MLCQPIEYSDILRMRQKDYFPHAFAIREYRLLGFFLGIKRTFGRIKTK